MFGALIKTWFAKREGIDPGEICSVSVMPCTAKKFECTRPEMKDSGYQDVDISITVQELAALIRAGGIDFLSFRIRRLTIHLAKEAARDLFSVRLAASWRRHSAPLSRW